MNFVFENYTSLKIFNDPCYNLVMAIANKTGNFLKKNTSYESGNTRFKFSDFVSRFFEINPDNTAKAFPFESKPLHYVISTGVAHHPVEWAGRPYNPSALRLFSVLNKEYLTDLQEGRAIFLIDQSHEGYQTEWLWEFIHVECKTHNINPTAIVYVTGNQDATEIYNQWHKKECSVQEKIKVIPVAIFDKFIMDRAAYLDYNFNFKDLLDYKHKNFKAIKLFDCLNRGTYRTHRIENYLHLVKEGLDSQGYITMPGLNSFSVAGYDDQTLSKAISQLPLVLPQNFIEEGSVFNRILKDLYMHTWVSLVTEASYYEKENTLFVSEKTYKPMICLQPFIVVGSKGTLAKIRELGYKTFHPYIDESYDDEEDSQRFKKIIDALVKINSIEDKVSWYQELQPILEHNRTVLKKCQHELTAPFKEFQNYYKEYFKEC
jgi:hypothetical protein